VQRRFAAAGIDIGSETADLNVRLSRRAPADRPRPPGDEA
jgi:hypothetical protein